MGAIAEGFVAYAQPLIDETDGSFEGVQKALSISQICFNLALLPEDGREKVLSEARSGLDLDDDEFDAFRHSVVEPMIRRHHEMFPLMHQRRSADNSRSGFLSAIYSPSAVYPPTPARAEKYPGTDRYAPCPCNSGRKYKFCCGKKGR